MRLRRSRLRWLVPLASLVGVVAVGTVPGLLASAAAGTPNLPALSPAELLVKVHGARPAPLSGTVELSADLGLPSLGSLGVASDTLTGLLSGTHDARVWIGGPEQVRVALPAPLAETNWIRNGTDVWSWDSASQRAVHATVSAGKDAGDGTGPASDAARPADDPAMTPAQLAERLLARIDPTTQVTVGTARYVAGRPVYDLGVVPRSADSTIGSISIAVDAATGLPLDVRITPQGSGHPALELGFTHLSLSPPAASTFDFRPPPGATVVEAASPSALLAGRPAWFGGRSGPKMRRRTVVAPADGAPAGGAQPPSPAPSGRQVTTVGQGWDSVAILSGAALPRNLQGLLDGATAVTVNGSTARLVTSRLLNGLVLADGRIAVGAVTPQALEHAVTGR